ncbi:6-hydroxymethylpterin diphosphokinase MptE-like protein [Paenibacillus nanensis]|nr:6-hydroxymethylpterin diphosphokinase MptE-like protein [Paenibacillus nanensis]
MDQRVMEVEDTLDQVREFMPKLIQACDSVEQLLYKPVTESTWQQFGEIVEGMDDLYRTLNAIYSETNTIKSYKALAISIEQTVLALSENFQLLNNCMDDDNYTGASDIIRFELIPLFQQLTCILGDERTVVEQRFYRNMTFLKSAFPDVYKVLENEKQDNSNYQITCSHNGCPNIGMVDDNDRLIYLYSQYDPVSEAERWSMKISANAGEKTYVLMYGLGLGYHAEAYSKAFPEHRLTIYEPDKHLLLTAMQRIDLRKLFDRLNIDHFVVGNEAVQRKRLFYRFLRYMKGTPDIVAVPLYYRINKSDMEQFSSDAQTTILHYQGEVQIYDKFGWEWMTNSVYNMGATLVSPSILGLKNKFEGLPAVIVGAGPSLAEDIEVLRKLKDHALIIAAGTTIQSMLHFGIEPHLIVSMDGSEANYRAFKNLNINHIPLLYTPMVKYKIIDDHPDLLLNVHFTNDFVTKYLMDLDGTDPVFPPNNSVSGTAIQAAIYMGCKEIIFTGQDFSYPGGDLYAPGARHFSKEESNSIVSRSELYIENVQGEQNRTTYSMKSTLADIENLLSHYTPDIRFVNTSKQGAKIKHTEWESLQHVWERYNEKHVNPDFFVREMEKIEKHPGERVAEIRARFKKLPNEIKECRDLLKDIEKLIETTVVTSRQNQEKCRKAFVAIDTKWKQVVASVPFKALFFTLFKNLLHQFERDLPELFEETNWIRKSELAQEIMKPLIQEMLSRMPELLSIVEEGLRRVEARV